MDRGKGRIARAVQKEGVEGPRPSISRPVLRSFDQEKLAARGSAAIIHCPEKNAGREGVTPPTRCFCIRLAFDGTETLTGIETFAWQRAETRRWGVRRFSGKTVFARCSFAISWQQGVCSVSGTLRVGFCVRYWLSD